MAKRGLSEHSTRTNLGSANKCEPFQISPECIKDIRECVSLVAREFYRPVLFRRLIDTEASDTIYEETIFKTFEDAVKIPANITFNAQELLYLPIAVRQEAEIVLEIAELDIEKAGYTPEKGRDIFLVDGLVYTIINGYRKDVIQNEWANRIFVGRSLNILKSPKPANAEAQKEDHKPETTFYSPEEDDPLTNQP